MKAHSRYSTTPGSSHAHSRSASRSHSSYHGSSHSKTTTATTPKTASTPKISNKTTTPLASPRQPYSVGQNMPPGLPPKLSPGRAPDGPASSPNYFGLAVESAGGDPRESSGLPREAFGSSPSSSIKSFAAAIPKQLPLDANPEFEAFRRQADLNSRSKAFSLAASSHHAPQSHSHSSPNQTAVRPRPSRWHTHASESRTKSPVSRPPVATEDAQGSKMDVDQESFQDSAYVSSESKRNSESSLLPKLPGWTDVRFESPRPMDPSQMQRFSLTRAEDRDPRLSLMEHRAEPPSPALKSINRAATLPTDLDASQPAMISPGEFLELMADADEDRVLLLDIRSSQHYAQARIQGALNICIPTTLLKRATFNIQKLQQTFQRGGPQCDKFSRWREMDLIVVYDAHSSKKQDAVTAQNMIKKFMNEGFTGKTCILRGGFTTFHDRCPEHVDDRSPAEIAGGDGTQNEAGGLAPVIGGVSLPTGLNDFNPFFSNIRQNMDLADGVGQMEITRPRDLDPMSLPRWLREAVAEPDHGKKVSEKFLQIEQSEQNRMRSAYSAFSVDKGPGTANKGVQLCGVEKGGKNRYKDILPFEHARVRLQDKPAGACDYVNASHLRCSRSNKQYIATQGPLPATFEDFWSVIWEQDVRVIVMLTAESEGGQLKCHPYWKGRDFGAIRLKLLSEKKASLDIDKHRADSTMTPSSNPMEFGRRRANTTTTLESTTPAPQSLQSQSESPYVIIRKFALSHASHPFAPIREITHLHFPAWPDFGTPAQPSHLLALVELANIMQRAALPVETASIVGSRKNSSDPHQMTWYDEPEADRKARPMLVHCSAGCGRTGTFCTVDSVLDMLKRQRQAGAAAPFSAADEEGDVSMADTDEPVSPMTSTKTFNFQSIPRGRSPAEMRGGSASPTSPGIDTTWLNDDSVDLIQQTVEDFRGQRLSMVQSLRQFVLCYETVLEWLHRLDERTSTAVAGRPRSGSLQRS